MNEADLASSFSGFDDIISIQPIFFARIQRIQRNFATISLMKNDTRFATNNSIGNKPKPKPKPTKHGKTYFANGDFLYFHYCCDNFNDVVSGLLTLNAILSG